MKTMKSNPDFLARMRRWLPPPVILLIFMAVDVLTANPHFVIAPVSHILGLAIAAVSLGFILFTAWQMHHHKTTLNPLHADKTTTLVTHGCYRFSRNPIYLGMSGLQLAAAIYLGSLPGVISLPIFMLSVARLHIHFEEAQLRKRFGQKWDRYAQRVRRWL